MPSPAAADDVPVIAEVCDFIRDNLEAPLTLAALGKRAGMSPTHLQRVFKRVVGVSPRQFADAYLPGGVVDLRYRFVVADGLIHELDIAP